MSNRNNKTKNATILLVEDDPGDQELTRRALEEDVVRTDLRIVNDGKEALDYLHREGAFTDPENSPRPDLILLDLKTTSDEEEDVLRSYDLGCKSFIKKPVEIDTFIETIRELQHYWFELVTLPADNPNRR
jgi:CheY-like chemotaxis protein